MEPQEFKAVALRPIPIPEEQRAIEGPEGVAAYWETAITSSLFFEAFRETCFAIALNVRHRIIGHYLVGTGTLNSVSIHARDVFRIAILANAYCIILAHNHPSGDATPSSEDIRVTRELARAGTLLKIELQDHVIIGAKTHVSLRHLGHCSF